MGGVPPAFAELWKQHRTAVEKMARKLAWRAEGGADALVAVGQEALWEASTRFEAQQGVDFWAYASYRVRGAMIDELRRQDPLGRHSRQLLRQDKPLPPWTAVERVGMEIVMDTVPGNDNPEVEAIGREEVGMIRKYLSRLPENLQYVLRRTYLEGATLLEVGVELGVGDARVCQIRREALSKLREEIMVYCDVCRKTYLDGLSKCPKCKNRIRHLRYDEQVPEIAAEPKPSTATLERNEDEEAPEVTAPRSPGAGNDAEPEVRDSGSLASLPEGDEAEDGDGETEGTEDADDAPGGEQAAHETESEPEPASGVGSRYLITLGGKTQGVGEWARELGLSEKTIYERIAKKLPPDKLLEPVHPGKSADGERIMLELDGQKKSVLEWSQLTKIAPSTIIWRMNAGWSPDQILPVPPARRTHPSSGVPGVEVVSAAAPDLPPPRGKRGPRHTLIEHEGKRLNLEEWARLKNLRPDTIRTRIKRGWKLAEALDTPEVFKRYQPPPETPPEPAEAAVKVTVAVTPKTASLLAAMARCDPASVSDDDGVLARVIEVVRSMEEVDARLAQLKERKAELLAEFHRITKTP